MSRALVLGGTGYVGPFIVSQLVARGDVVTLDDEGRAAFVKTSGKTGLHVLVPWRDQGGYDDRHVSTFDVLPTIADAVGASSCRSTSRISRDVSRMS